MHIQVSGQQIDTGDALRAHVAERLGAGVGKFFDDAVEASVTFAREGHGFACAAAVHVHAGLTLHAEGQANDIYASFDQAADRLDKQLRRYKRRLKDRHKKKPSADETLPATAYVIDASAEDEGGPDAEPVIVAETPTAVPTLAVGEAVMRLDVGSSPVLLFRNAKSGGLNVVYRRPDGHVGWIDPSFDPARS